MLLMATCISHLIYLFYVFIPPGIRRDWYYKMCERSLGPAEVEENTSYVIKVSQRRQGLGNGYDYSF